jgi:hypothetical protein
MSEIILAEFRNKHKALGFHITRKNSTIPYLDINISHKEEKSKKVFT